MKFFKTKKEKKQKKPLRTHAYNFFVDPYTKLNSFRYSYSFLADGVDTIKRSKGYIEQAKKELRENRKGDFLELHYKMEEIYSLYKQARFAQFFCIGVFFLLMYQLFSVMFDFNAYKFFALPFCFFLTSLMYVYMSRKEFCCRHLYAFSALTYYKIILKNPLELLPIQEFNNLDELNPTAQKIIERHYKSALKLEEKQKQESNNEGR